MAQRVEREKVAEEEGDLVNRQVIRGRDGLENDLGGRMQPRWGQKSHVSL